MHYTSEVKKRFYAGFAALQDIHAALPLWIGLLVTGFLLFLNAWRTASPNSSNTALLASALLTLVSLYSIVSAYIRCIRQSQSISTREIPISLEPFYKQGTQENQTENRYQILFEQAADSVVLIDAETGALIEFNEQAHANLGYTRERFQQLKISDIDPAISEAQFQAHTQQILTAGIDTFDTIHRTRQGELRNIHVTNRAVNLAGKTYVLSTWQDVTKHNRIINALAESEERLRVLIEHIPVGLYRSTPGPKGRFIMANPAVARMHGFDSVEELLHTPISELYDDPSGRRAFSEKLIAQGKVTAEEIKMKKRDGAPMWGAVTATVIWDHQGNPKYFDGIIEDITERKQAQETRARMEAQLHQAQKMEALGALASGIAHSFRNVLSAVLGFSEIALKHVEKGSELELCITKTTEAAQRGADLVQRILRFSRPEENRRKSLDLGKTVREALSLLRGSVPPNIEFRSDIEANPHVIASPMEIHQVIMDLGANAFDAMQEHGGVLYVRLTEITVPPGLPGSRLHLKPGAYACLTFSDTGYGIPEEVIGHIFELFFTTKEPGQGTGLGLASVHGIVKSLGGDVEVNSQVGRGATFTLYFPRCDQTGPASQSPAKPEPSLEGQEHILFVDDEAVLVVMAEMGLTAMGYSFDGFTDSLKALDAFRALPGIFDVAIVDHVMLGLTGMELAQEIHAIRPDIPIILSSGFTEGFTQQQLTDAGLCAWLPKPSGPDELAHVIRQVLDPQAPKV